MKKIRAALLTLTATFACAAGAYPADRPDPVEEPLVGYSYCVIFITPNVTAPC